MTGTSTATDLWVRRYHPVPAPAFRLFCFPHAGGSATFFFPVSAALSGTAEVLAMQYPGRQDRRGEQPIGTIAEMADQLAAALRPWTDMPFAFFGHSMGAVLAFETALRLEKDGISPTMLFASGRRAPSLVYDESVHRRDDDGLIEELKKLSGTDSRVLGDEELLRMVLPAIRSDYRAIESYRCEPGTRVSCPVTVLTGDNDPKTTLADARAWQDHTDGPFDMAVFPGGHFYLADHQQDINHRLAAHARTATTT
ncbi:thioesterase II family protein [Streptomyces sp. NPDC059788]|uniref:thioesterase II family protein n=1 Tax=Streptomyces sp. NPDC059788 TaxID=3346948 RepID=UPI0036531DB9